MSVLNETAVSETPRRPFLRTNAVTLGAGLIAVILGAIVWFGMPHDRNVESLWVLLFKLTPFIAGVFAVAWIDLDWAHRLRLPLILLPLCFLVFFCFFVPRLFFFALVLQDGAGVYYTALTCVPFIILAFTAAFRLGGGSRETALRLPFAMILLQLSGLEDLAFLTVNDHTDPKWTPIPEVWDWADHITVFLGHPATKHEAYAFITVHVILALLVLFLPRSALTRFLPRR